MQIKSIYLKNINEITVNDTEAFIPFSLNCGEGIRKWGTVLVLRTLVTVYPIPLFSGSKEKEKESSTENWTSF